MAVTIIGTCNHKGGAGKTTLTILMAWRLAKLGKRVLVVDGDPQANCTVTLMDRGIIEELDEKDGKLYEEDATPEDTEGCVSFSYHLFEDEPPCPPTPYLDGAHNVSVIPAMINDRSLSGIDSNNMHQLQNPRIHLTRIAEEHGYDFILIDTPPTMGPLQIGWICTCDYIVMPLQLTPYALFGAEGLTQVLTDLREQLGYAPELLGVIANNYDARVNEEVAEIDDYRELLGQQMFNAVLPHRASVARSIKQREPIWNYTDGSARQASRMVVSVINEVFERAGIKL